MPIVVALVGLDRRRCSARRCGRRRPDDDLHRRCDHYIDAGGLDAANERADGLGTGGVGAGQLATETGEPDLLAYSQCLRDNGIADFPDPDSDGISLDPAVHDPDSPQFKAAEVACQDLRPPPNTGAGAAERIGCRGRVGVGENRARWRLQCADGSEFAFWERQGDPTKVVLYLEGGGSCSDATTCAFTGSGGENDYYDFNLSTERPELGSGIFDFDRPDNPFADYSFIYESRAPGTWISATPPVSTRRS